MIKLHSLDVWKRANELARAAYSITLTPPLSRHVGAADQIRRAAISIPANLAEGYALGTTAQLVRSMRISHGSAAELMVHLTLALDLGLAPLCSWERFVG